MKLGSALSYSKGTSRVISLYEEYIKSRAGLEAERQALVEILSRPERVRTGSFSASASGTCLRARQLQYMGTAKEPIDAKTANIFANGDYVHMRFQVAGLVGGWLEQAEVPVAVPGLNLRGTMDGKLSWGAILEIKSINANGFSRVSSFGADPKHVAQVHAYMLASGMDEAHIVYESKNDQRLKEFHVTLDQKIVDKVAEEFATLSEATNRKELLPMLDTCKAKEGFEYKWCPYQKTCPLATFASSGQQSHTRRGLSIRKD